MTLHERGLVYRGTYMVNWAPLLQTAVSDLEVEYSEEPGTLFHFRYPLAGGEGGEFLPVATTRPETILGDTAVAVHPEDPRRAGWQRQRSAKGPPPAASGGGHGGVAGGSREGLPEDALSAPLPPTSPPPAPLRRGVGTPSSSGSRWWCPCPGAARSR